MSAVIHPWFWGVAGLLCSLGLANGCAGDDADVCSGSGCGTSSGDGGVDGSTDGNADAPLGDFSLAVPQPPEPIVQGNSVSFDVTVTRENGSGEPIFLTVEGMPSEVTSTSTLANANQETVQLGLHADTDAMQGAFTFTIVGTGQVSGVERTLLVEGFVRGRPGSLDTTFGDSGYVETDFVSGTHSALRDLLTLADDSVLAIGYPYTNATGSVTPTGFALAKFQKDGQPATDFGSGTGVVVDAGNNESALTALDQGAKGIVVTGVGLNGPLTRRHLANGDLDTSFGNAGTSSEPLAAEFFNPVRLFAQSDGKIVVVGFAEDGFNSWSFAATRLTADGDLDPSFGTSGFVIAAGILCETTRDAVLLPDDTIVIVGDAYDCSSGGSEPLAMKLTASGQFDSAFGAQGKKYFGSASSGPAHSIVDVSQGGFIVVHGNGPFAVSSLDSTATIVDSLLPIGYTLSVARTPDSSILGVGVLEGWVSMVRFSRGLAVDSEFGSDGYALHWTGANATGGEVAFQSAGRTLLGLSKILPPEDNPGSRLLIARYW
jgi:uncharacterized delta-60 repeat protein